MEINNSTIYIDEVRLHAFHGVDPQEQAVGADFLVSREADVEFEFAAITDEVAHTVSYADMFALIRREMAKPSALLENVVFRIAQATLAEWPTITKVRVRVTKENPPMGADCRGAGVMLELINDKTRT